MKLKLKKNGDTKVRGDFVELVALATVILDAANSGSAEAVFLEDDGVSSFIVKRTGPIPGYDVDVTDEDRGL